MADNRLYDFYNSLAFGEFDKARKLAETGEPFGDEAEKVIIQALRLMKILEKTSCPDRV